MISMLLTAFIVLCIVGLILWGINQIPGIPPIIKTVIYVIMGSLRSGLWSSTDIQFIHHPLVDATCRPRPAHRPFRA